MIETTTELPQATVQDLDGLTVLRCGRCQCRSVRIPPLPHGEDWHCPWCDCRQAVEWRAAQEVPA